MNSRRSFIRNMGAGASAALASTAGMAGPAAAQAAGDPAQRAAVLEAEKLLRGLHQAFELALDRGQHDAVIGMFADDAQVVFNGGVFSRRAHGVSRLYGEIFPAGKTGARMESAPGFELASEQLRDSVEVAADLRSATGVFPYSIRVGRPLESGTSLVAMARLHGEGVQTWWEGGVYRVSWRKDDAGRWQISRLAYDTLSRADYRAGRSYAQPIAVAPFLAQFPADPLGPDALA